jgi:hypothetical protein
MAAFSLPIVPFAVPEKVSLQLPPGRRQDGIRGPVEIALTDLSDETLVTLIEEFTASVMAIARPT